jgi:hypothetical protein
MPKIQFYVSADGCDQNPGTIEKPFASLQKARDAVRQFTAVGLRDDVEVLIRGGSYHIADTVVFGLEDSGTVKKSRYLIFQWPPHF